jgi:hypothetical protein
VTNSQWIDWTYMENKHDPIFDRVIAACQAKHLRDILAFKKDWDNEVIAQFYSIVLRSMETLKKFIGWPRVSGMKCHILTLLDFWDLGEKMLAAQEFT